MYRDPKVNTSPSLTGEPVLVASHVRCAGFEGLKHRYDAADSPFSVVLEILALVMLMQWALRFSRGPL